jgi:hypothetical protein
MWDKTVSLEMTDTVSLCLIKHQAMKKCGGMEVQRHALFIAAVGRMSFTPTIALLREKRLRTWVSNFFGTDTQPSLSAGRVKITSGIPKVLNNCTIFKSVYT